MIILLGTGTRELNAQKPAVYEVAKMSFNENAFSDISPVIIEDGILFCSNRRFSTVKDRTSFDGSRLYNIYIAQKKDSNRWNKPRMVKSERMAEFNRGPLCMAPDGKTIYFTSEVETGEAAMKKDFRNRSGIFFAEMSGNSLDSLRSFKYNSKSYETGHPSVSNDGKYLFFASDMPGGQGGSDIWCCEFINGEWSKPVNLGSKINTPRTESFPYMHPTGKLYFTSNRPGGAGKLDVYSTSMYNGQWDAPVLLPDPINSPSDDFAFVASENLQNGYFTSNRAYDDDIFSFSSTVIRKASCNPLIENNYCYRFTEENSIKYDSVPFLYKWDFGDGDTASGVMVEHCYRDPGKYIYHLDVVNLVTNEVINNEKTDTLIVLEEIQPYITSPDTSSMGKLIRLDASETNLPGWNIVQFYWNFGDETIDVGEKVEKTFSRPGTYNIQLIVTTEPGPGGVAQETCISKNINIIPGL